MGIFCNYIPLLQIFLFIFSQLHFGHTNANANCIHSERKALMEFKRSLIDESNRLSSWRGPDCCVWDGITCNNLTGRVQTLNLSNPPFSPCFIEPCLGGEINPSILNLEHLEHLDLSNNNFSEVQIPPFLGSLKNLQYLNLFRAGFIGDIPQHLGNLSNLQHLFLGDYFLSSKSLKWITGLSSLQTLDLSGTNLNESLDWFYSVNMLPSLSSLTLVSCGLVGEISPSVSHVNLTSLVSLDLTGNNLNSTLPLWLFNLSRLENLSLSFNNLRGPIPNMFENLPTLTMLQLSENSLSSSLPDSLCNLTGLTDMELGNNQLQGSLPLCIGNMASLRRVNLRNNELGGEIPAELGHLKQLQALDISTNSFIGELSESLFVELRSLKYLSICKNQFLVLNVSPLWIPPFQIDFFEMDSVFIGTSFPPWLHTQRDVYSLVLKNASISGAFPEWCQTNYPKLAWFDLSHNSLTGHIPVFYINHTISQTINTLVLANNQLTGTIPEELCNLRSLSVLSLANNNLVGRIPLCLGNLQHLGALDLANNSLSGHVPSTLGNLEYLRYLHLNGNKLFGVLPSSLQNLTWLITLDVSENQLRGVIPEWIDKEFSRLQFLRLESNNFYGEISVNLCQLSSLQILNLAQNNLVGSIPRCLGNLSEMMDVPGYYYTNFAAYADSVLNNIKGTELEYSSNLKYSKFISLSGNHIHGEIPDELMDLKGVTSLNLSNNNLSGRIPEKISNLKYLESLDLSMNQFSGPIPQSLANIDALSYLNLSFNNLAGHMPSGSHFDTLLNDPSVYEGNNGLCGQVISKSCPDDPVPATQNGPLSTKPVYDDNEFEFIWLYAGVGHGFLVGFLGVLCLLYFKDSWRHAYFGFLGHVYDKVWVAFAIKISQFQRRFN